MKTIHPVTLRNDDPIELAVEQLESDIIAKKAAKVLSGVKWGIQGCSAHITTQLSGLVDVLRCEALRIHFVYRGEQHWVYLTRQGSDRSLVAVSKDEFLRMGQFILQGHD